MCGRFDLIVDPESLQVFFELPELPFVAPRYNIAPGQPVAAVHLDEQGNRIWNHFQWGLIPSWGKDISYKNKMINARCETVHEKASFKYPFNRRRCLIPVTGFYEWLKLDNGNKQPVRFHPSTPKELWAFAGIYEYWMGDDGTELQSCAILTREPNQLVEPIHSRMPVIISPEDFELWLDSSAPLPAVRSLFDVAYPAEKMNLYPVSTVVNNVFNDNPACIEPLEASS